jgi:diguanylate cyclase (GGDEF)-like protein
MRVLIADQETDHRANLVSYIQTLGHTVQEALTERDVIDQCRSKRPELIFIDSQLSGVSGIELIRQIRLLGGHAIWAPIVLMSKQFEEQQMMQGVEAGADDLLIKPIPPVRMLAKVRSAERLANLKEEVFAVAHNLVIANRALENIATQDVLTGVGNSNTFDDDLERYWFDAKRNNAPLAIVMANLDYFKAYNQSYGAVKGDDAIKRIAEILKSALPKGDSSLARLGGETFAILLPNTSVEEGMKAAENLRAAIDVAEIPHINSGCSDHLTASFGVSVAEPGRYTSPWDLKEAVDFALYQSKHHGRNRSYFVSTADVIKSAGKTSQT